MPAGTVLVDGVYLVPTGTITLRQCRAVARTIGFAVPCPAVAPADASTVPLTPNCQDGDGCLWQPDAFIFTEEGFAVPPGYQGMGAGNGHFVLIALRAAAVDAAADPTVFCLTERPIRTVSIEGTRGTLVACPEGGAETSGHVLLRWVHDGILIGVSFHGVNATNVDLDLAVAHHLTWIGP